tara:strand:- start:43 stop:492 length:450 start_codon:yes stop_codon:yes gene_type:complete
MKITECEKSIGYVIFDCVCLFLGASSLRASLTAEGAEAMAEAAKPVLSKLEEYIVTISAETSSKTDVATAVFGIISTIYSGGCIGEVISAWLNTLTVGDAILYGATALGTIIAAVSTDGLATIGVIIVELATAGWLISDSIKCSEACEY